MRGKIVVMSTADKQRRFDQRHFGEHGDLCRLRLNLRRGPRAALERLAAHHELSLTMLVERLVLDADRHLARQLTGEARARYASGVFNISTRRWRGLAESRTESG
jgi:hypothetical protein